MNALKGNHEDACVKAWEADKDKKSFLEVRTKSTIQKEWENFGGKHTMQSFGINRTSEIPEKYIRWMKSLDYFVEMEKFVAVHDGLDFTLTDPFSDTRSMLWIRELRVKPETINHKILIHGHVPVNLEFIDMAIRKKKPDFIDLDNGIYVNYKLGFGNLVALETNSMEYKVQTIVDDVQYDKPF